MLEDIAQEDDVEAGVDSRSILVRFDVADDDRRAMPRGHGRAWRVPLESGYLAASRRERRGDVPGRASDIEHADAGRNLSEHVLRGGAKAVALDELPVWLLVPSGPVNGAHHCTLAPPRQHLRGRRVALLCRAQCPYARRRAGLRGRRPSVATPPDCDYFRFDAQASRTTHLPRPSAARRG